MPYERANETIELTYENYNASDSLKMMLSKHDIPEKDIPSGFEVIGDVAHLNLIDSTFPFRFQIGQVILDKNPRLRVVVCKVGKIEAEFRFYHLECIAGEEDKYETI